MKLGPYQVHPVAGYFPMMNDDRLKDLADDIQRQGQSEPIVITDDETTIVDGRNRWRACELLSIEPVYRKLGAFYTDEMIRDYIISANIKRRQLTPGQLAMLAADLEPEYAKAAKQRMSDGGKGVADLPHLSRARDQAAAAVGAHGRSVSNAKALKDNAADLAAEVRAGTKPLDSAYREYKKHVAALPKPEKPKGDRTTLTLYTHEGKPIEYAKPKGVSKFNETTGSGISWAAWSWNPVTGCLHGCPYCYAREIATSKRFADAYPAEFTPLFHPERLQAPANTTIPIKHANDPAYNRVFVCSMADLYGRWVPEEWIDQVHAAMLDNPQWQYITLTKFPDRYPGLKLPDQAWIGTSVDEQKRVRIAERAFSQLPNNITKWLSLEPLREPLEFTDLSMFDWVVIGAQTETRQPNGFVPAFAPPFDWVDRIYRQAREAGCAVHMKPNLGTDGPGMQLPNEYPGG